MTESPEGIALIRTNIAKYGYHVYAVTGGATPRYMYTIGNSDRIGCELIFAGGAFYTLAQAKEVMDEVSDELSKEGSGACDVAATKSLFGFSLGTVHPTWVQELMLGATDYYDARPVSALQLVPDHDHHTIDTPDMSRPLSSSGSPSWRWHLDHWPYAVPEDSMAVTNLAALRGAPVTEAARWEQSEWELFAGAGPDVPEGELRVVPLGVLLGFDPSLEPVIALAVGKALWREGGDTPWLAWENSQTTPG